VSISFVRNQWFFQQVRRQRQSHGCLRRLVGRSTDWTLCTMHSGWRLPVMSSVIVRRFEVKGFPCPADESLVKRFFRLYVAGRQVFCGSVFLDTQKFVVSRTVGRCDTNGWKRFGFPFTTSDMGSWHFHSGARRFYSVCLSTCIVILLFVFLEYAQVTFSPCSSVSDGPSKCWLFSNAVFTADAFVALVQSGRTAVSFFNCNFFPFRV